MLNLARASAASALAFALAGTMTLGGATAAGAAPNLTIEPLTWNVVGLDSNNPLNQGPYEFLSGARVCNTGPDAANSLTVNYIWDTANTYVNISPRGQSTETMPMLLGGACQDVYFLIRVTRTPLAYDTTRRYHITASASNAATVSTPTPRELFVEHLISQNRNDVVSVSGPTTVYVGQTVDYAVQSFTATQGYEQLSSFLDFPNLLFRVRNVSATYSAPPGATNDRVYSDACGWDPVPGPTPPGGTYRSCTGVGKAGGDVQTTYSVQFRSAGSSSVIETIYDYSGSSYHYNADIGINNVNIQVEPPLANIQFNKHCEPAPATPGATITCTIEYGNTSPSVTYNNVEIEEFYDPRTAYVTAAPLPTSGNNVWAIGDLSPGEYGVITVTLTVNNSGVNDGDNLLNRAEISDGVARANDSPGDPPGMFNYAEDTLPVALQVANTALLRVTKTGSPDPAVTAGNNLTYTITYQNLGPATSYSTVLTDTLPSGASFVSSVPAPSTSTAPTYTWNLGNLASGASGSITMTVSVSSTLLSATMLTNYVTLRGNTGPGTNPSAGLFADAEETQFVLGGSQVLVDLSIAKTDGTDPVAQGASESYTLTVTNLSANTATNVVVSDTLDDFTTFGSTNADCTAVVQVPSPQTVVTCNVGTLAGGASRSILITTVVESNAPTAGTVQTGTCTGSGPTIDLCNIATVTADQTDPTPANNTASAPTNVTAVVNTCNMSVTKTDLADPVVRGGALSYTLRVDNLGTSQASDVTIVDTLDVNTTFVSDTPGAAACSVAPAVKVPGQSQILTCNYNVINSGASKERTINVTVDSTAPYVNTSSTGLCTGAEDLCNRVTSVTTSNCKDTDLTNNTTSVRTNVTPPSAELTLTKTDGPDPVGQGGTLVYTFNVSNAGPGTATNVAVVDTLPANVTYSGVNTAPGGCTFSSPTLTCTVGTIVSGSPASFTVTVLVNANATATTTGGVGAVTGACTAGTADLCNTATATSNEDLTPPTATQPTNVTATSADLSITKTDTGDPLVEGGVLVYTFSVTNTGPNTANNVVVTDTLTADELYLEDTAPAGCVPGPLPNPPVPNQQVCTIGPIASGGTVNFTMTVFVPTGAPTAGTQQADPCTGSPGTDLCNTAVVSSSTTDPTPGNNTAVEPTNVLAATADLMITKTDAGYDPAPLNGLVTYTIHVENPGPQDAQDVVVVDVIDPDTTYVGDTFGCVEAPVGTLTCDIGAMLVGQGYDFEITVQVDTGAPTASSQTTGACLGGEDICNGITVSSTTADPDPDNNSAEEPTNVTSATPSSIGDRLWLDEDGDGVQDAGEDGLAGVTVRLYDATGTILIASTTTDTDGRYVFRNVDEGSFLIRVDTTTLPAGLAANPTYDLDDGAMNPDAETAITVAAGAFADTGDFGFNWVAPAISANPAPGATGAIGDRLWNDADMDGIQDFGEAGIPGVTVRLLTDDNGDGLYGGAGDNAPLTTTSDASGHYIFDGIAAGSYVLDVVTSTLPAGYSTTPTGDPDSDGDNTTNPIVLAPGDVYVRGDFGYPVPGGFDIGSSIFLDADADGSQDPGEPGIAGVAITLLDSSGDVIASTVSDANGNYLFPGLPNGTYTVVVADTADILADVAMNTADPDGGFDRQSTVVLAGADDLAQNFGFAPVGHAPGDGLIGDVIFLDRNTDGIADAGEGMQGVTVELYDAAGTTLIASVVTDANGQYVFGRLDPADTYVVRVLHATLPNGGAGFTNSVDPDGGLDEEATVDLTAFAGGITFDQDFAYEADNANSIGGTVFDDANGDGTFGGGETDAYEGITVILRDQNGNIVGTTTTDPAGNYQFDQLPDGTYTVEVSEAGNVLGGLTKSDGPSAGADNNSQVAGYSVTVGGGQTDTTGDFGYFLPGAAFGNFLFEDLDDDGIQDPGEVGIEGVVVTLTITYPNGDVTTVSTVSDSNGAYSFGNLLLDEDFDGTGLGEPTYEVTVATPAGHQASPINQGADPQADSNDPSGASVTLVQGVTDTTNDALATNGIDFGFTPVTDLSIVKVGPGAVIAGNNLTFTIIVTNNGPSDAQDVEVLDPTPAGLTFVSNTGDCATTFPCTLGTVPSGESRVITSTYFVPLTYAGADPIVNVATVTSSTVDTDPSNDSEGEDSSVTNPVSADLGIVKTGPVSVSPGSNVVFTLQVTNNGPDTAGNVTITDPTPGGGISFVSASAPCAGGFPCNVGTVLNGGVVSVTVTYAVPPSYTSPDPIENFAVVNSDETDPNPANDTDDAEVVLGSQADLVLDKSGPATVSPGDNVVYTIAVTNNGPSDAAAVSVDDPTPAGLVFVSNSGACAGAYPCSLGTVLSGQTAVITTTYSVPANYATPNPIVNTATVTSTTPDPSPGNETDDASTTVILADLALAKSGPATVTPGNDVVFTSVITNNGPSAATSVVVTDPTPPGLSFVSNAGDCVGAFPCNLGNVPNGGTRTITSTYSVPASYTSPAPIDNIATVSGAEVDPTPADNSDNHAVTLAPEADLSIVKTGPATVMPGTSVVYTITVTNNGTSDAQNVTVADPTPTGLTFVSNAGACLTAFPCSLNTIAAGQTRIITTTFQVPVAYTTPNPIVNVATVSSTTPDPNPGNETDDASSALNGSTDLSVTKSDPGIGVDRDSDLAYSITVTNNGPSTATGVTVVDVLDSETAYVSDTGGCTQAPVGTLTCVLGSLGSGASTSFSVTVHVSATASYSLAKENGTCNGAEDLCNTVTVSGNESDPVPANNSDSEPTNVTLVDLAITKSDSGGGANVNEDFAYTIAVTNGGPNTATNVTVVDTLDPDTTYVADSGNCTEAPAGVLTCALGTLTAGSSTSFTVTVHVGSGAATTGTRENGSCNGSEDLCNTATVSASQAEGSAANNTDTEPTDVLVSALVADLAITKTDLSSPIQRGAFATYTVSVTNAGPDTATNAQVVDTLDPSMTYVGGSLACTEAPAGMLTCLLGDLASGATASFDVVVHVDAAAPIASATSGIPCAGADDMCNRASVSSQSSDPDPSDNVTDVATDVVATTMISALTITKSDVVTEPVLPGTAVTYQIIVDNAGPDDATNVVVYDTLDSFMTYVSDTAGCTTSSAGGTNTVLTCPLGTIAAGGSATFDVAVTVAANAPVDSTMQDGDCNDVEDICNDVMAATESADFTIVDNEDSEPTDVSLSLTCNDGIVDAGEECDPVDAEVCNNGIDDNGNNRVDCADASCQVPGFQSCDGNCLLTPSCQPILDDPAKLNSQLVYIHGRFVPLTDADPNADGARFAVYNDVGEIYSVELPPGQMSVRVGPTLSKWIYKNRAAKMSGGIFRLGIHQRIEDNGDIALVFTIRAYGDMSAATLSNMTTIMYVGDDVAYLNADWSGAPGRWRLRREDLEQ